MPEGEYCGDCGHRFAVGESEALPDRLPCPECGSMKRHFARTVFDQITAVAGAVHSGVIDEEQARSILSKIDDSRVVRFLLAHWDVRLRKALFFVLRFFASGWLGFLAAGRVPLYPSRQCHPSTVTTTTTAPARTPPPPSGPGPRLRLQ